MLKDDLGKVKCATVLAKLGSSDVRIDASDDHTTRRWRIELQTELKSFFHKQQDAAAARVEAITASANQSDNNVEAIIQAALAFEWSELVEAAADPLYEAARSGMAHVLVQAGIVESANATDDDQRAAGYALLRAAEMAGMKWAQDELVEDPEAKWAFSVSSRNRIRSLVMRAFQEKTPITELGDRIRQAAVFPDTDAETFAEIEIARAENWGVSEAWSTIHTEMAPGKGRELALLYNLPDADRFVVEAEYEIRACKGPKLAQHLHLLDDILAELAKSSFAGPAGPKARAALNKILMFLAEAVPAGYVLMDLQRNDRFTIVERWRQEALRLPTRRRGIAPHTRVSKASHGSLTDPQNYTPALAQVLFERNWIKVLKETTSEPAQGTRQSSVNAYICGAATKLLKHQTINDDRDYIDAHESGHQLIALPDVVCPGKEVQRIGIEEIPDDLSSKAMVVDYATMPGPKNLRIALQMLHEGYKVAEVAKAIGTDSKHFRQTILRIVGQMGPAQARAFEDWINYREFYSASYTMDLSSIVSKLSSGRITKLAPAQTQRPDPTRANATGQTGMHRQVWMK